MRQISASTWECTECGTEVWIERGRKPIASLITTSTKPRERVVTVDGQIVHRCSQPADE
jgi:hypothetical protein